MECKCGYIGLVELGDFLDERFDGKYKYMKIPFRCPKCKTNKDIKHLHGYDSIAELIKFPKKDKRLSFLFGGADKNIVGYSIQNLSHPDCSMGSAISIEDFEMLRKEFPDYIFVGIDVDKVNLPGVLR